MKSIFEIYENKKYYEDIESLYESFQSNTARMIRQDAEASFGSSFKEVAKNTYIDGILWDKIQDSDIELLTDRDDYGPMLKAISGGRNTYMSASGKRKTLDNDVYIFLYKKDKLVGIYYPGWQTLTRVYKLASSGKISHTRLTRPSDQVEFIKDCDEVYIVHCSNYNNSDLKSDRGRAKADMIPNLDDEDRAAHHTRQGQLGKIAGGVEQGEGGQFVDYCRRLARDAKERYEKIKAENRFKRTSDTTEIENIVSKCLDGFAKAMSVAMKDPEKYQYTLSTLKTLIQGNIKANGSGKNAYGYVVGGLIECYQKYVDAIMTLSRGKSSYPEMYVEQKENNEKAIRKIYEGMKKELEKFNVSI